MNVFHRPACVAAFAWAWAMPAHALDKARPDGVSGHGPSPAAGRVDGVAPEVEKAPRGNGG